MDNMITSSINRIIKLASLFEKMAAGKPIIMYHGTSVRNLPSILSQGLIPNPKERAWHEDPDASWYRPSRVSIGGIYLTNNLMTALSSSYNPFTRNKEKNISGLVIVEVIPNILISDEDDLTRLSELVGKGYIFNEWLSGQLWAGFLLHGERDKFFQEARKNYIDSNIHMLEYQATHPGTSSEKSGKALHPELINRLRQLFAEGFIDALRRKVAYLDDYSWRNVWRDLAPEDQIHNPPPLPSPSESEAKYASFIDKVTKALKMVHKPNPKDEYAYTARTLNPVGYTGNSKIIAVLAIDRNGKKDEKGDYIFEIKVLYPGSWSEVPEEVRKDFQNQWNERIGGKIEFKPA
jgi:hypothetical protein